MSVQARIERLCVEPECKASFLRRVRAVLARR
jgi:hypothetical protein